MTEIGRKSEGEFGAADLGHSEGHERLNRCVMLGATSVATSRRLRWDEISSCFVDLEFPQGGHHLFLIIGLKVMAREWCLEGDVGEKEPTLSYVPSYRRHINIGSQKSISTGS